MPNRRGTIDENIIHQVTGLSKKRLVVIRKELQETEPEFDKWIRSSIKDDVSNIKFGGVAFHSEDAAKTMGSILLQAKIEGYLMAMTASDRAWSDKFFLECVDENEIPYEIPINAFMAGKLDSSEYKELENNMTPKEKKDITNWKNIALNAYKKNNSMESSRRDIKTYLSQNSKVIKRTPPKDDSGDILPLEPLTP